MSQIYSNMYDKVYAHNDDDSYIKKKNPIIEVEKEEAMSFSFMVKYIMDNIAGFSLLILSILIIVFVDYINRLNSAINAPTIFTGMTAVPMLKLKTKGKRGSKGH